MEDRKKPFKVSWKFWKSAIAVCGLLTAAFIVSVMYHQFIMVEKPQTQIPYPMHYEISNKLGTSHVQASHRVTFDKTKNKFVYYYRVENCGDVDIMFRWDVLEQAVGESLPNMFSVKAKSVYEHRFESDAAPMIQNGGVLIYRQVGSDQWRLVPEIFDAPGPIPFGRAD